MAEKKQLDRKIVSRRTMRLDFYSWRQAHGGVLIQVVRDAPCHEDTNKIFPFKNLRQFQIPFNDGMVTCEALLCHMLRPVAAFLSSFRKIRLKDHKDPRGFSSES